MMQGQYLIAADGLGLDGVIAGLSLRVAAGERIAFVGPNGCGKSALAQVLAGVSAPTGGSLRHAGDVRRVLVSQAGSLLPWLKLRPNVEFGGGASGTGVQDLLGQWGLEAHAASYPHELTPELRRRAEIARALAAAPDILCLDGPPAGVDAPGRARLRSELLARLAAADKPVTLLCFGDDAEEAACVADRIFVLRPRPTSIQASFVNELPHPRRAGSSEIQKLREAIEREMGL